MVRNIEPQGASIQIPLPQQITQKTLVVLERQVDDALAQRPGVIEMTAAGVQLIDSAGLNWLLTTQSRLDCAGAALKIVDPARIVTDIFLATRLDSRFTIAYTEGSTRNA